MGGKLRKFKFWKSWIRNPQSDCGKECCSRIITEFKFGIWEFLESANETELRKLYRGKELAKRLKLQRKTEFAERHICGNLSCGRNCLAEKKACRNLSCGIEPAKAELHNRVAGEELFRQEAKFRVC